MGGLFVFLLCYMGYILSLYRFCNQYLNHFKINKKIFVLLLLVIEIVRQRKRKVQKCKEKSLYCRNLRHM